MSKCYPAIAARLPAFTGHEAIGYVGDYFPYAQIAMSDAARGAGCSIPARSATSPTPWMSASATVPMGRHAGLRDVCWRRRTSWLSMCHSRPHRQGSHLSRLTCSGARLKPGDDKFKAVNSFTRDRNKGR